MKRYSSLLAITALTLAIAFTSCKKSAKNSDSTSTEVTTHSDDQNTVSANMDAVTNDVNAAVETTTSFTGRELNPQTPQTPPTGAICNANVAYDTANGVRKITITYNGSDCFNGHSRTGSIIISMPTTTRWKNAGATLTVTYQNLKITRLSDNKSITINGTHTIVNVSGGLLINLPTLQTITHTINSDNMSITFDDGSQRTWHVARQRVYTYANNEVAITITGKHTEGSNTQIAEWGTNRFGHAFTTSIVQPLVLRSSCSFRLGAGQILHQGFATITATFGLDASGNATGCPGNAAYYCKIDWTALGSNHSVLVPY